MEQQQLVVVQRVPSGLQQWMWLTLMGVKCKTVVAWLVLQPVVLDEEGPAWLVLQRVPLLDAEEVVAWLLARRPHAHWLHAQGHMAGEHRQLVAALHARAAPQAGVRHMLARTGRVGARRQHALLVGIGMHAARACAAVGNGRAALAHTA